VALRTVVFTQDLLLRPVTSTSSAKCHLRVAPYRASGFVLWPVADQRVHRGTSATDESGHCGNRVAGGVLTLSGFRRSKLFALQNFYSTPFAIMGAASRPIG
jgi:hypothetical protein